MIKVKENCKYDVAALGSMGERAIPIGNEPLSWTNEFKFETTAAEYNVLGILANLGLNTAMITALVTNSAAGHRIRRALRERGITPIAKEFQHNGLTGPRHQIIWSGLGKGVRAPLVEYDRAEEAGALLAPGDFDWNRYFKEEGIGWVHVSGLFMALSQNTNDLVLEMVRAAKENNVIVSVDLNYREQMWKANGITIDSFRAIAAEATVIIGNEEDMQLALGIEGPEAGGKDLESERSSFRSMLENACQEFPNVKLFATTLREVNSADSHRWGGMMWYEGKFYDAPTRDIEVHCRIGGGDAFAGGLIYACLKGMEAQDALNFAWAHGAIQVTFSGDISKVMHEDEVWRVVKGNARVVR